MVEVGKPAPSFALKDNQNRLVRLEDQRGKWVVLYFYPKDDTPGCTVEACEFSAGIKAFEGMSAAVLGCSPDSVESHQSFAVKHKLTIPLLADPDKKVIEAYGAWGEKTFAGKTSMGVIRSTVIIDPKGAVAHHWPTVKAEGHAEEVRRKVEQLRGTAKETKV